MSKTFQIAGRNIGPGHPSFIIAEMSANHQQDLNQAIEIVRAAKAAGADAIKLQTYTADTLTIASKNQYFQIKSGTQWDGTTLHELYKQAYTPWEWQPRLKEVAEEEGLICFSSPFDHTAVEFLEALDVPAYKIASFEIVDIPLIEYVAKKNKPIILSTGMATQSEIEDAVRAITRISKAGVALLKCTSAYPAPAEEMNLKAMQKLSERFGVAVGLSDHTLGIVAPVVAVSLGACIIEKHFTLSREVKGPDSAFSLEPKEFKDMVTAIRTAEKALGTDLLKIGEQEAKSRSFRRSLFVVKPVKAGEKYTSENVRSIRPSDGLPPKHLSDILGKTATQDVDGGTPLRWDLVK